MPPFIFTKVWTGQRAIHGDPEVSDSGPGTYNCSQAGKWQGKVANQHVWIMLYLKNEPQCFMGV